MARLDEEGCRLESVLRVREASVRVETATGDKAVGHVDRL